LRSFVSGAPRHDRVRPDHDQNRIVTAQSPHLPGGTAAELQFPIY
jgi:hypothetical protein